MTLLGIDYGSKRVGIAVSDTGEVLAFPQAILENTRSLVEDVKTITVEKNARMIVLGKSQDLKGNDNPIMNDISVFKKALEESLKLPVLFQEEYWTSEEARRFQGKGMHVDASAAALILQRFLDIQREQNNKNT
jgi:putative Holliday junction resolvase